MNKLIFVFTILFFTAFAANAQNKGTQDKLIRIANEYIQENPDDEKAKGLIENTLSIKAKYSEHLDKLTNGMYSTSKGKDKKMLEKEAISTNEEAAGLQKAIKQIFKANNNYFSTVSVDYNNVVTQVKLKNKGAKKKKF